MTADTMSHRFRHIPHRPPWWPENEAWPPVRGHMRHNPFFRRLGCAFVVFNLIGFAVFFATAAWIANLFGLTHLPPNVLPWMLPFGIGLLVFVVALVILGVFGLRRGFFSRAWPAVNAPAGRG